MPATYEKIASTTLGSATSSITFSSITSAYTDLRLVLTATVSSAGQAMRIRLNGDTGTNYSFTGIAGDGGGASAYGTSYSFINCDALTSGNSTTIPSLYAFDFFSYAGSTKKTNLMSYSGDRNGSGFVVQQVNLWNSTAAINEILIYVGVGNLNVGTTATLYGILKA
jgi:hypothetical protein